MPAPLLTRCTLLCSLLLPLSGVAAELYRYVDDKGVTVLSRQGVPPEFIGKGYEVLNDQGRVLRVIPPAPTPEEFARMQADKARASSDAQLLRLYTNLDDVDRAREVRGRRAREPPRRGVEPQPGRERLPVGQARRQREPVAVGSCGPGAQIGDDRRCRGVGAPPQHEKIGRAHV